MRSFQFEVISKTNQFWICLCVISKNALINSKLTRFWNDLKLKRPHLLPMSIVWMKSNIESKKRWTCRKPRKHTTPAYRIERIPLFKTAQEKHQHSTTTAPSIRKSYRSWLLKDVWSPLQNITFLKTAAKQHHTYGMHIGPLQNL